MDGDYRVAAGITDHDKRDWDFVIFFFFFAGINYRHGARREELEEVLGGGNDNGRGRFCTCRFTGASSSQGQFQAEHGNIHIVGYIYIHYFFTPWWPIVYYHGYLRLLGLTLGGTNSSFDCISSIRLKHYQYYFRSIAIDSVTVP